jgi:hypothetical protein
VFPSTYDRVIACPGDQFCCELGGMDASECCGLTNTTTHPFYKLGPATTVAIIGEVLTATPVVASSLSSFPSSSLAI